MENSNLRFAHLPDALEALRMTDCKRVRSFDGLPLTLQDLDLSGCERLKSSLADCPRSLKRLRLCHCPVKALKGLPGGLKLLDVSDCTYLKSLADLPKTVQ